MPHQKTPDGYLSVTEVLSLTIAKPFLLYWYGKNGTAKCEQIKRESQEIGTEIHEMIENRFATDIPIISNKRTAVMVNSFWNKFVIPYQVKPLALEVTIQDEKLKLQGTFDAYIMCIKGGYMADWKTSNSLDKVSGPLQLSMYDYLYKGSGKGVLVRIDKETYKVEIKWYEDLRKYVPIWKAALKLARYIKFGVKDE
jgi:hypothetical protein